MTIVCVGRDNKGHVWVMNVRDFICDALARKYPTLRCVIKNPLTQRQIH